MKNLIFSIFILVCFVAVKASAQITSGEYYRIINTQTGKYVSITDNEFSAADIVAKCGGGSALAFDRNATYTGIFNGDNSHYGETMPARTAAFIHAGKFLAKDISLKDASNGKYDPGTIIKISKNSGSNYNLEGQNVKLSEITNQGTTTSSLTITIPSHYATLTNVSGSTYTASITLKVNAFVTATVGTKYFIDNNGKFAIDDNGNASNNGQWEIVPVNEANLNSNYLAVKTIAANEQYGKYYTTLRAAFPFKVAATSTMKVYNITSTAGGVATLEQISSNNIVPAGLPVVIESDNLDDAFNKIVPNTSSGTSRTTALYNNYGVNDNEIDCSYKNHSTYHPTNLNEGSGDKIGYFNVKKYAGSTIYKFGINEEGRVGFWTPVAANEIINGNEAYSTVQCALFPAPTDVELKDLPNNLETGYHITNPLTVAYIDKNNVIYAKDDNGIEQSPSTGEINFMEIHYPNGIYGKHYNWVAIEPGVLPTLHPGDSRIEASGKVLESTPNRRMKATVKHLDDNGTFDPNTYCIVNFMDKSYHKIGNTNFFFATPEANEIAEIIWAQWDGNNTFIVPPRSGFTGAVNVDFSLYDGDVPTLTSGHEYRFIGLVKKTSAKDASNLYQVYPLSGITDMEEIVTGVQNAVASGNVVDVKYYNIMGVASDVPFKGVNIVVTTYDNGTRTTSKILK